MTVKKKKIERLAFHKILLRRRLPNEITALYLANMTWQEVVASKLQALRKVIELYESYVGYTFTDVISAQSL